MSWLRRYRIRQYVRDSLWLFPALSTFAGLAAVALLSRLERAFGWEMEVGLATARAVMGTVAGWKRE